MKQVHLESDTRPIALTSVLSKVFEDYVVARMIKDVGEQIDNRQFTSLPIYHLLSPRPCPQLAIRIGQPRSLS